LRAPNGIVLVQPPSCLPLPTRPLQRHNTRPDPNRPRNAYLREDQVLARLPALSIRLALGPGTTPPAVPEIVARLRADRITLTYNPADQTLTADTPRAERIAIS
jgi:hypothetical protein